MKFSPTVSIFPEACSTNEVKLKLLGPHGNASQEISHVIYQSRKTKELKTPNPTVFEIASHQHPKEIEHECLFRNGAHV